MKMILHAMVFFIILTCLAAAGTTYGPVHEETCTGAVCTKTLYSYQKYVHEDGQWKDIKDARSLRSIWKKVYIRNDVSNYELNFTEYNYTYLEGTLWVKTKASIPFKVCFNETYCRSFNVAFLANTYGFIFDFAGNRTFVNGNEVNFIDITGYNPLMMLNWTLGSASTTVKLQEAGSENLQDTYVDSLNSGSNYGSATTVVVNAYSDVKRRSYMMFNISSLPAGIAVADARIVMNNSIDASATNATSIYHVNDTTWNGTSESTITWNNQPCGVAFNAASMCNLTAEDVKYVDDGNNMLHVWDVTDAIKRSYANGDGNVSFALKSSEDSAASSNGDYYPSKEFSVASSRPYLNITYTYGFAAWHANQSSNPMAYDGSTASDFNITWNTTNSPTVNISKVLLEINLSSGAVNRTMTNATYGGDIFNYSLILPPGGYYWKSYANTTGGDWNVTDSWGFFIGSEAPTISGISRAPDCVQNSTTNVVVSFTQDDDYNISESYCNWTAPSSSVVKTNSSLTESAGAATCQYSPQEVGTWYYRIYVLDTISNQTSSSLYSFDVVATCNPGGGGGTPGGGGGSVFITAEVSQCRAGWYFDNYTQRCLPSEPILPGFEQQGLAILNSPILPDASSPLNSVTVLHVMLAMSVLVILAPKKWIFNKI